MPNQFGFPMFDAKTSSATPPPLIPVLPTTNSVSLFPPDGTAVIPDGQGVPPDYVPLPLQQHPGNPGPSQGLKPGTPLESIGTGTPLQSFGLGSSV